mmetsp:Transcript_32767/g.104536  ORF Transcript_32767/g.104536 Transcript_32767/m.104536 type:complete len:244 (+) Transcript_32767:2503-3234(+)
MGASAAMGAILRWSITSGMYTPRSHDRPTTQAQRRTCRATTSSESSIVFAKAVSRAGRCSVAAGPAYQRAPSRVSAARVRALAVQSDSSLIAGGSSRCNSRATNMAAPTGGVAANNVPDSSVGGGPPPAAAAAAAPSVASSRSPPRPNHRFGHCSIPRHTGRPLRSRQPRAACGSETPAAEPTPCGCAQRGLARPIPTRLTPARAPARTDQSPPIGTSVSRASRLPPVQCLRNQPTAPHGSRP